MILRLAIRRNWSFRRSHAGGEACGEKAMAVIQPNKRRRATPEARPAEKEKETREGVREEGQRGAYPRPLPKGRKGATPEVRPAEKTDR